MDVDPSMPYEAQSSSVAPTVTGMNPLKRSTSAPTINVLVSSTADLSVSTTSSVLTSHTITTSVACSSHQVTSVFGSSESRVRRFSCSGLLHSPTTPVKNRLVQIKQEESLSQGQREVAHEREIQVTQQIYRSWENLAVDESVAMVTEPPPQRSKSIGEPLHIQTSLCGFSGAPSPTRSLSKQCFSPSLQQPINVRSHVLSPTPSPSPTRKSFRRSVSPITLRPSPLGSLGIKRKMEMEWGDRGEAHPSPAKRFHSSPLVISPVTPDRSMSSPFAAPSHSNSVCSLSSEISDLHTGTNFSTPMSSQADSTSFNPTSSSHMTSNSTSSTHSSFIPSCTTLSFTSSTPSPCYMFRTVRDSIESSRGTDSEASDLTETTDISEHNETSFSMTDNLPDNPQTMVTSHVTPVSQSERGLLSEFRGNVLNRMSVSCNQQLASDKHCTGALSLNCQLGFTGASLPLGATASTLTNTDSHMQAVKPSQTITPM